MKKSKGFYIAPFAPDGELIELAYWGTNKLSNKWFKTCQHYLNAHGENFSSSWEQELNHIETKLTADSGAGIGSFFAHGELAISTLYITGTNTEIENEVIKLFVETMQKVKLVQAAKTTDYPFNVITQITKRPFTAVVVWANPAISDNDEDLIRELSLHFAAAFFEQYL